MLLFVSVAYMYKLNTVSFGPAIDFINSFFSFFFQMTAVLLANVAIVSYSSFDIELLDRILSPTHYPV